MEVAIVGGGICGLSLALHLKQRGIDARVYERVLSADQIMTIVNDRHLATSKATVYNTLNLFRGRGLIREVIVDPNKVFYDPNTQPHHHLYNVDTGELIDVDADAMSVSGLPRLPDGMVAEGVEIIVRVRSGAAS